jgi:hypothetical protein
MVNPKPTRIFRGTVEEVFSHRDEIPSGAMLELKVFEEAPVQEITLAESLASLLEEASQVQRAKPVCSDDPLKQQVAEAVREKFRRQGFEI